MQNNSPPPQGVGHMPYKEKDFLTPQWLPQPDNRSTRFYKPGAFSGWVAYAWCRYKGCAVGPFPIVIRRGTALPPNERRAKDYIEAPDRTRYWDCRSRDVAILTSGFISDDGYNLRFEKLPDPENDWRPEKWS